MKVGGEIQKIKGWKEGKPSGKWLLNKGRYTRIKELWYR